MPRERCPAGQVWSESEGRCVKQLPHSLHSGNPEMKENILSELRVKYRFSRPEGDKVLKAIENYILQRDKSFVYAILEPVRDGKFIGDDLVAMVGGTYWIKPPLWWKPVGEHSGNPERW